MCPNNFLMLLAVFAALLLLVYSYGRQVRTAHANLETVKGLLETPEVEYKFFGINFDLRGRYQGRRVVYVYRMSDERSSADYDISMEPRVALPEQKWFLVDYPRPTQNTRLIREKIRYSKRSFFRGGLFNLGNLLLFSPEEVREVLQELSEAARRVETGEYKP